MNEDHGITGARVLNQQEIGQMNAVKRMSMLAGELIEAMSGRPDLFDQRWVSIGKTDLQKGFMALTRAVAQPTTF